MSRIVWFHPRQVFPPRGGGEFRSIGLMQCAIAAGHEVLVVAPGDGPANTGPLPEGLSVIDVDLQRGVGRVAAKVLSRSPLRSPRPTRAGLAQARRAIADFAPELAIVSQVMASPLAKPLLPEVPWVYDAHNVEHELFASHLASASSGVARVTFRVDLARVAATERRLLRESDAVIAVSPGDADGLVRAAGLLTRPTVVPSSMAPPERTVTPTAAGPVVLFVGTLDFPPNVEAVDSLVEKVMPAVVAELPDARLLVVGRRASRQMREVLARQPWVDFVDDAPDISEMYHRARVAVLPFRSGSGTKLKLYEALAHGIPTVSTPKALSGVDVRSGTDLLVGNDVLAVASLLVRVLRDDALATTLGAAGRSAFDDRLSWERAAQPPLTALLDRLAAAWLPS